MCDNDTGPRPPSLHPAGTEVDQAEHTLIVFKPDAVQRGLVSTLMGRFESVGLDLLIAARRTVAPDFVLRHHDGLLATYGRVITEAVIAYMTSGPLIATIWEGLDATAAGRRLIGPTFPAQARPGTIRGDYAHFRADDVRRTGVLPGNLVHGSRTVGDAKREIELWFGES